MAIFPDQQSISEADYSGWRVEEALSEGRGTNGIDLQIGQSTI
jgi:hypothetical protein